MEVLLEIGAEEIPARFLPGAVEKLKEHAERIFDDNRIVFHGASAYATPRRLVLLIPEIGFKQMEDTTETIGPPAKIAFDASGRPTKAALGFAKKLGVDPSALSIYRKDNGEEYVQAAVKVGGGWTFDLLPEILKEIALSLNFPKSMRWGYGSIRFVRPIQWILAICTAPEAHFGDGGGEALVTKTVEFEIEGVKSGNTTRGHRFLAPGDVVVPSTADYDRLLGERFVVADEKERERRIWEQAEKLAASAGGAVVRDDELLSTAACLVEYPIAVLGGFSEKYLRLPEELLISVMKGHQKYFSIRGQDGKLINRFVVVSNTRAENADTVRTGAERVIRARFEDAEFYYVEDTRKRLADRLDELSYVTYHEGLGSLRDKCHRLVEIVNVPGSLSDKLCPSEMDQCFLAASYAKADLITGVVREFPELQGIMGYYYALKDGMGEEVATAIREQYLPAFSGDRLPGTDAGAVLGLADRMDAIAAFFSKGLKPTGSEDPFALRRHALSVVAILLGKGYAISLKELLLCAVKGPPVIGAGGAEEEDFRIEVDEKIRSEMLDFFTQRIEQVLLLRGYAHDLIQSVLANAVYEPLTTLVARLDAIREFKAHPGYGAFLTAIKRVRNITPDKPLPAINEGLLKTDEEGALYRALSSVKGGVELHALARNFPAALEELASLTEPINVFFDKVLVMDKDEKVRENRLGLLRGIWECALFAADFSKLREAQNV